MLLNCKRREHIDNSKQRQQQQQLHRLAPDQGPHNAHTHTHTCTPTQTHCVCERDGCWLSFDSIERRAHKSRLIVCRFCSNDASDQLISQKKNNNNNNTQHTNKSEREGERERERERHTQLKLDLHLTLFAFYKISSRSCAALIRYTLESG